MEMDRGARWLAGVVLPAVIVGLALVPWLVLWSDLPDPVATRFDFGGGARSSMPLALNVGFHAVFGVGASALLVWSIRRPSPSSGGQAAVATFVGVLVGVLSLFVALANHGQDAWQTVTLGWGVTLGAIGAALACAVPLASVVEGQAPSAPAGVGEALPLAATERAAWFGRLSSPGFRVAAVAQLVVGSVAAVVYDQWLVGGTLLFVGAVMAPFASVLVAVDEQGVRVRSGPLGWPGVRFPIDRIESASAIDLRPTAWGGWGYRGSVRLFRRAAWVLRAGPALELHLHGGRRFAVTVEGAPEAAAVLNGLLTRASRPSRPGD